MAPFRECTGGVSAWKAVSDGHLRAVFLNLTVGKNGCARYSSQSVRSVPEIQVVPRMLFRPEQFLLGAFSFLFF